MASQDVEASAEGVHFVGSVRLTSQLNDQTALTARDLFETLVAAFPQRLRRIPDGEPGFREQFIMWQYQVFVPSPWIVPAHILQGQPQTAPDGTTSEIKLNPTKYDEEAMKSYGTFQKLREDGVIPVGVRFQVCLPTPVNALPVFVKREYQSQVEPLYEALLVQVVENLQKQIPAQDLAIQWDMAVDIAMLENVGGMFAPWFHCTAKTVIDRVAKLAACVHQDVELSLHLCYGNLMYEHFKQPEDTGLLVEVANLLSSKIRHSIDWIRMPVPRDRKDDAYFAPLKKLNLQG